MAAGVFLFSGMATPASAEHMVPARLLPEDAAQLAHEHTILQCGREGERNPHAEQLPGLLAVVGLECVGVPRSVTEEVGADLVVTADGITATSYTVTEADEGSELSVQLIAPVEMFEDPHGMDGKAVYSNDVVHVDICNYRYGITGNDIAVLAGALQFLRSTTGTTCW